MGCLQHLLKILYEYWGVEISKVINIEFKFNGSVWRQSYTHTVHSKNSWNTLKIRFKKVM